MKLSELNDLDFSNAGSWPTLLKIIAMLIIIAIVAAAGYWFDTKELLAELERTEQKETQLRREFEEKQRVVANVEAYRARLEQLRGLLDAALQQLPTRTEMPDLLESISDTGKVNGLDFQLFKPESEQPREEFLAVVPISIRARATYHQFGAFVSSIAALDRIVTLESANLVDTSNSRSNNADNSDGTLNIQATLQTYRYLDDNEQ